MSWNDLSYVIASSYRTKILLALKDKLKTPTEISRETNIHKGNISKVLGQLLKKGLVECVTPARRKGRFYRLTDKGKNVIEQIEKRSDY